MDFRASTYAAHYRDDVAAFVDQHFTPAQLDAAWATGTSHDNAIHKAVADRGWIGAMWPTSVGGAGMHPAECGALWEALNYHRLPVDVWELTEMAAWVIVHKGSDGQRRQILSRVRSGDLLMALGYSEPESGSDVAAAKTTAARVDDGWAIRGSKIFTTGAHVADYVLLLARTDPGVQKHRGLSMFLVPLRDPRVHIQPIHTFGGERTNAVFFDDVMVPANAVVGDVNEGWAVLNLGLDFERSMMGTYVGRAQRVLDDLLEALGAAGRAVDPVLRRELTAANVRIESARALCDDVSCRIADGLSVSVGAAMAKLVATEVFKDLAYLGLDAVGPASLTDVRLAPGVRGGCLEHWFRHAQIATIYGGSNEIQRNIISHHELRLPRA